MTSTSPPPSSNRRTREHIVLSTYRGRNADVLQEILEEESMVCPSAPTLSSIVEAIKNEAALIVVTEEILADKSAIAELSQCLNDQPSWSDIPIIVLMRECQHFADCLQLLSKTAHQRSVVLLELPIKRQVFASMVRSCLQNRRRQYALRDTLHQLQTSNQTLESFSYTAAHELRNPLGVMTTSFDLLARMTLDDKQQKIVDMGQRTARSMNQMLSVLLDYGKVRSQSTETFTPVDTTAVLQESVSNFQSLIRDRSAEVTWTNLPRVQGNHQLLIQLFSNLIKNAIVHNEAATPIVIISVEAIPANNLQSARWLFSVSDNGPGISSEAQAEIFTIFNRGGKSRTEGSGIGLALCRRVVEQHQGEISVRSVLGEGSTFYFDLPQAETAES